MPKKNALWLLSGPKWFSKTIDQCRSMTQFCTYKTHAVFPSHNGLIIHTQQRNIGTYASQAVCMHIVNLVLENVFMPSQNVFYICIIVIWRERDNEKQGRERTECHYRNHYASLSPALQNYIQQVKISCWINCVHSVHVVCCSDAAFRHLLQWTSTSCMVPWVKCWADLWHYSSCA